MLMSLLADGTKELPISDRLDHASFELKIWLRAARLPAEDNDQITCLVIFLSGAADAARDLEEATRKKSRREMRMTPVGDLVGRIIGRMVK